MVLTDSFETEEDSVTRRQVVTALGGAAAAGLAGCSGSDNPGNNTTTSTETETPTTTPTNTETTTETETETETTTEEPVELPQQIDPELSEVNAQSVYEQSLDAPANYNQKMANATHEETDVVGLTEIAEEFEGDRVEQIKNVAAAAATQYRNKDASTKAMVKAVNELDWFQFNEGCRADLETMLEGAKFGEMAVFTYEDENGNLRNDLMNNSANVTRPSREWKGPYQESGYMDIENTIQSAAMDFNTPEDVDWDVHPEAAQRFKDGQENFLWGARHGDANLVFSREGGLLTTEKLKTSPEAAREVKDEVNQAYAKAEMEGYDLDENYLAVEEVGGELSYSVVTESQAEEIVWI